MDADAFVKCVHDHKDRVYTYAAWMVRNRDEASDLTQEAFMRLWNHHQRVQAPAAKTWLLKTVSRLVIDASRKKCPSLGFQGEDHHAPASACPEEPILNAESKGRLADALRELPERDQALLHLSHVQGLSSSEVGQILAMNDGAVRVALARARKRLLESIHAREEVVA